MKSAATLMYSLAAVALASANSSAAITLVNPSFYGQPYSTAYTWAGYASPQGPNAPSSTNQPAGMANYFDRTASTDGATIVGASSPTSGRIYSQGGVVSPEIDVPLPALGQPGTSTIVLQAQVLGNSLDTSSLRATSGSNSYAPATITFTTQSIVTGAPPPAPATSTEYDYTITWTSLPATTAYTLTYVAAGPSSSQGTSRVDTLSQTPEPTAIAMLGAVFGGVMLRRRRTIA